MKNLYAKLASQSTYYAIGNLAEKGIAVLLLSLYTAYLSAADFGIIALVDLLLSLLVRFSTSPMIHALKRYYYKPDLHSTQKELVFLLFVLTLVKAIAIAVIFYFLSGYLSEWLFATAKEMNSSVSPEECIKLIQLYAYTTFFLSLTTFAKFLLRLHQKVKYHVILSLSSVIISSTALVFLLVQGQGIIAVAIGRIILSMVPALGVLPLYIRTMKPNLNLRLIYSPLQFGYPRILSGYANLLLQSGDRYLLKILTSSLAIVGVYSFAYRVAAAIHAFFVQPIMQALVPLAFQHEHEPQAQKRFISQAALYYYAIALFIVLGLSLFAKDLIVLVSNSKEYYASASIVAIIAMSYALNGLISFATIGIEMRDKPLLVSSYTILAALVNCLLNLFLIPRYGAAGAAYATLLAYLLWTASMLYYSGKLYELYFDVRFLLANTALGLALYLIAREKAAVLRILALLAYLSGSIALLGYSTNFNFYFGRVFRRLWR